MIEILNTYDESISDEHLKEIKELPKNVRQIGEVSSGNKKIFIEDYVYTYLYQYASSDMDNSQIAVLLGKYYRYENQKVFLISGAVQGKYFLHNKSGIILTSETWTYIYDKIKEYFDDYKIIGWMFSNPGYSINLSEGLIKAHTDNFPGTDRLLLVMDPLEKESGFYLYERQKLRKQNGYYIYYERNEKMHQYMLSYKISNKKNEPEEEEEVIVNFRKQVQNRKQEVYHKKLINMLYVTSGALAIIVLVIGAALLNNYDKMRNLETTLNNLTHTLSSNSRDNREEDTLMTEEEGDDLEGDQQEENNEQERDIQENSPPNDEQETSQQESEPEELESQETEFQEVENSSEPEVQEVIQQELIEYTIQEGDTLAQICFRLYNNSLKMGEIMEINGINNPDKIYIGQSIKLPNPN
ncbi:LysM domain-containing protein [Natranaerovirga hydrolytica]|uniref:LysM domain-containing protein n=1 Tax=Natranaerovirga hydrolytica TaxID=680378 RepID=A0A4R1M4I6_9FIRM|nr:LysM domain-containing protein [Natranaerovirga hydrolytica]TCK86725.1 LysM domain-containing protein [Natranaerovirga hydrolytica]